MLRTISALFLKSNLQASLLVINIFSKRKLKKYYVKALILHLFPTVTTTQQQSPVH